MAKRASGEGNLRQRPDGRWEARYSVGRDPGTGKQIQRSVYGSTQKEVRQKLATITAEIDKGTYIEPSKMTVGAWLDIWLKEYLGGVKPSTVRSYRDHVRLHIKPALGALRLDALQAPAIQAFINSLSQPKDGKKPLSPKSIKNVHGVLHAALERAAVIGYLRYNPSGSCILPRVEKKEITPLDEGDMIAFLQAIKGHRFEPLFMVDMFTGLRRGEVIGLTWDCIDFTSGTITVRRQMQKDRITGVYSLVPLKNDKARVIVAAPTVMDTLTAQKRAQGALRIKAGALWERNNLVFTDEIGHHLMPHTVYREYKNIVRRIGIPEARFHDLRHTYAVTAIRSGDDIKTVQSNLGHHTAAFTLDTYGHVIDQMKRDSADRMERFIKGIKQG